MNAILQRRKKDKTGIKTKSKKRRAIIPVVIKQKPRLITPSSPISSLPLSQHVADVCKKLPLTAIIVNFKTLDLTKLAVTQYRRFYNTELIVVDNGSHDKSTQYVKSLSSAILNTQNIGHGPALHQAIKQAKTRYVLTLDSDCILRKGDFLERMLQCFEEDSQLYAVGWLRWVDRKTGVPLEWHLEKQPPKKFVSYIHPVCGLYDREKYIQLKPFFHHGAPCLQNMIDAENKSFRIKSFNIFDYVEHLVAGTRRMYNGGWNPSTTEQQSKWMENDNYPI